MNINISKDAKDKLGQLLEGKKVETSVFRVKIKGFTWCGPLFTVALEKQNEDDKIYMQDGYKFTTSKELKDSVRAVNIILEKSIFGKKLKVTCN